MIEDADLLLIQNRLVNRMMEAYDANQEEKKKIDDAKKTNTRAIIDGIYQQIGPFMDSLEEQSNLMIEIEREARRKNYEQLASILVEMIPLLADAIALRLKQKGPR